jgi:hypothetical protein
MTRNNNLEELLKALETIRAAEYSELPKNLLEELLKIEYENQYNRAEAQEKAVKLIDNYFTALVD